MSKRISGMSFDFNMDGTAVHAESISLNITDNTAVAKTRGVPDGYTDGDVEADGEIELDSKNLIAAQDAARSAGSWRGIALQDFLFYAKAGDEEMKVEAFGCKIMISDLLNIDPTSADKAKHKIKYIVTSPNFVHINGIPYLSADDTRDLLG
ncbi:DUF2597 family protein [Klebsiella quasipneumoniae]|jgi:Protein of unknown function (DUF2597).|uniref:Phage protein n=1 Tax=Raoultella lignicola TaxID=3040939 RepID=A0ABU9FAC8_9ENTR|nr:MULTISPECIES: phage protein [Klebsiella]HCI6630094.1 DUF2597 family protein [Klebsiella quasipneumoniae subsp. similipneumoniae]EIV9525866.1 DUF2597 family protein [Klebsiella aerogenes]KJO38438.1 tail protein [Klebsiella aerogenes]KJO38886.1 tail protein [Klebsiella aerogenes]KJO38908.1 tail protein [Klebsiella aerogenes]